MDSQGLLTGAPQSTRHLHFDIDGPPIPIPLPEPLGYHRFVRVQLQAFISANFSLPNPLEPAIQRHRRRKRRDSTLTYSPPRALSLRA